MFNKVESYVRGHYKDLALFVAGLTLVACNRSANSSSNTGSLDAAATAYAQGATESAGNLVETQVVVGAIQTGLASTPDTPTATSTQTPTPTNTERPTPVPTRTATRVMSPTPSSTPTPSLHVFEPSLYHAGDNAVGSHANGVVEGYHESAFGDYLNHSYEQFTDFPGAANQDYIAARNYTPLVDRDGDGEVDLPTERGVINGQDWWAVDGNGGLGFNNLDFVHHGHDTVISLAPNLVLGFNGTDGNARSTVRTTVENMEHAVVAEIRGAYALRYPSLDFTKYGPGTALAFYDAEMKAIFDKAIRDNGYVPDTRQPWPGPVDLSTVETFLDDDGYTCLGERPDADSRDLQKPGQYVRVDYISGLEDRTDGNDETRTQLDPRNAAEVSIVFDYNNPNMNQAIRIDISSGAARLDPSRPDETERLNNIKDSDQVTVRVERDPFNQCGSETVAVPTPVLRPQERATPKPADTPKPGETPRPSDTPGQGETPRPTDTVVFIPSPTRTEPPVPTTPVPTRTDAPTQPVQPSRTPGPTPTNFPTPTWTPAPEATPSEAVPTPTEPVATTTPLVPNFVSLN